MCKTANHHSYMSRDLDGQPQGGYITQRYINNLKKTLAVIPAMDLKFSVMAIILEWI